MTSKSVDVNDKDETFMTHLNTADAEGFSHPM